MRVRYPVFGLVLLAGIAVAAPINYGDFDDIPPGSVMYTDVTETANTPGDVEPLFGAPAIKADTLCFSSPGLAAGASGSGGDATDGQLTFTLTSAGRPPLNRIVASASGVYSLQGSGGPNTQVGYALSLANVTVLEVDFAALASPVVLGAASVSGGDQLGSGNALSRPWALDLVYDVDAALAEAGVSFTNGATKLEVSLDVMVVALAEAGAQATIEVNQFALHTNLFAALVPELGIMRSAPAEVTLSWDQCATGWFLQESADGSPGSWSWAASGSSTPVVIPVAAPRMLYRLAKP